VTADANDSDDEEVVWRNTPDAEFGTYLVNDDVTVMCLWNYSGALYAFSSARSSAAGI
jgi:hypothetical protein